MVTRQISGCAPADFGALVAQLDDEFIHRRGRRVSLLVRFPCALRRANVLVRRDRGRIVSALVARPFHWITPERLWNAVMIGMVWTDPQARGKGHASALLEAACDRLRKNRVDFAVLWSARPELYSRLGWIGCDCGCLATAEADLRKEPCDSLDRQSIRKIESLRRRLAPERIERNADAYRTLALPAEKLELFLEPDGYALVGVQRDTAYLHEIVTGEDAVEPLWRRLNGRYARVHVNERAGSVAASLLARRVGLVFQEKPLAMWRPLAAGLTQELFARWYIPFIDRV